MTDTVSLPIFRTRLAAAATRDGRPIAEIEQAAHLPRDRFRDFVAGRKRSLTFADAAALAAVLAVDLDWLAGSDAVCRGKIVECVSVHDAKDAPDDMDGHGKSTAGNFREGNA